MRFDVGLYFLVQIVFILDFILFKFIGMVDSWSVLAQVEIVMDAGAPSRPLHQLFAKDAGRVLMHDEWYRLVTCVLVHKNWVHFTVGTVCLACMSVHQGVERRFGKLKFELITLLGVCCASLCHFALDPQNAPVGTESIVLLWHGMAYADFFVNWDLLMDATAFSQTAVSTRCPLLIWLACSCFGIGRCLTNPLACKASLFYGFCLSMPFHPHVKSHSMVMGKPSEAYLRLLRVARRTFFTAAVVSMLLSIGVLIQQQERA